MSGTYSYGTARTSATALGRKVLDGVGSKPDELIAAMADLTEAAAELRECAAECERRALDVWPDEGFDYQVQVNGVGVFVRGLTGNKDTWDDRAAARAILKAAWESGEINHWEDAADVLLRVAHIDNWRIRDAVKAGLDKKEFVAYRTREQGRPCVHIVT